MNKIKSILLVEDDVDDQEFFTEALKAVKNTSLYAIANNGKEALLKLKESFILPELIFMDMNMPVMNGLECMAELFLEPRTKHIPVVFLTTTVQNKDLLREMGARAVIKKPIDGDVLRKQLEHVINMER